MNTGISYNKYVKSLNLLGPIVHSNSFHSPEQVAAICHEYVYDGATISVLASKYGGTSTTIYNVLKRKGISRKNRVVKAKRLIRHDNKTRSANETFFDVIDTEEKSYILGFLFADGCNHTGNGAVSLAITDKDILYKIASCLGCDDRAITFRPSKNANHKPQYVFRVTSDHMSERLTELGCCPRKSLTLKWPSWIPTDLVHHFVRGYFDGDGCISFFNKHVRLPHGQVDIVGTESFLEGINTVAPVKGRIRQKHNNRAFSFIISRQQDVCDFGEWLYADAVLFIERKKSRFEEVINNNNMRTYRKG